MRPRDMSLILKVTPKDQETEVPRDATVFVTAPRPVDHLSARGLKVRSEDREVQGSVDLSSDGRILFWRPAHALDPRALHHVTLSGIRDDRGATFDNLTSTFVTGFFSYIDLRLVAD